MNLKDQVLSIKQVQELQELGFDVSKYASMCWLKYINDEGEEYISLQETTKYCFLNNAVEPIPTLTIGDIIEVLPNIINTERFLYRLEINNPNIYYIDRLKNTGIYFYEKTLINNLFEALKWCIKNKHITI